MDDMSGSSHSTGTTNDRGLPNNPSNQRRVLPSLPTDERSIKSYPANERSLHHGASANDRSMAHLSRTCANLQVDIEHRVFGLYFHMINIMLTFQLFRTK